MWSIALATKSTGTMLVQPSSGPISGTHSGSAVAQLLDRLEEVVGPVDLVHLAGLGVADDDGGAVDAPRAPWSRCGRSSRTRTSSGGRPTGASGPRRTCPRGRGPCTVAGRGDRGDVVQVPGLERVGQLDGVARAADVERLVGLVVGRHVVDRREVEEVVDLALAARRSRPASTPERVLGQVADDRLDAVRVRPSLDVRSASSSLLRASPRARARRCRPRASSSCSTRWRPMKPVAPVTK